MPHVIALRKLTTFTKSKNVRSIQYHSFHGEAYRDVEKKLWTKVSYYDEDVAPLHIVRDGNHVPPIVRPGLHFVVNEQIRALLATFPHIRFEQVVFDKIVDFYYAKGDFRIYRNADRIHEAELQLARPDVPKFHAKIGSHYEVIVPQNIDIASNYPETTEVDFGEDGREVAPDEPRLKLSERMFAEYPLQYFARWHILSPALFAALESYFDFDFFFTERLEY